VLFSNSPYVQLAAMAAGVGIGIAPCCVGDEYPGLARLFPADLPELRPVWIVMHRDLRRVPRIRVVANAITDAFERNRQLLRYGSHKGSAAKTRLTIVRVNYLNGTDGTVQSVQKQSRRETSHEGEAQD
jgi:hypothetical protein